MQFEIEPHRGAGPISFGMSRAEVAEIMARIGGGAPRKKSRNTDCYFRNAFQVSFNQQGLVEFIGGSNDPMLVFLLKGVDVFDVTADELMELVRRFDDPDPDLSTEGNDYVFPQLILTLWAVNAQHDHKGGQKRPMFGEVGVGAVGYLEAIRSLRRRRNKG